MLESKFFHNIVEQRRHNRLQCAIVSWGSDLYHAALYLLKKIIEQVITMRTLIFWIWSQPLFTELSKNYWSNLMTFSTTSVPTKSSKLSCGVFEINLWSLQRVKRNCLANIVDLGIIHNNAVPLFDDTFLKISFPYTFLKRSGYNIQTWRTPSLYFDGSIWCWTIEFM